MENKKLISVQRHFRGFSYQRNYDTKEQFNDDMKKEHEGSDEICWAFLFTDEGYMVAEYRRGYTMAQYI